MPRKKTTYEKKGLARQLASSIFASNSKEKTPDEKWRPRKNQFERLDGDDDDLERNDEIKRAFSVESETGDYRREILFDRKRIAFEQSKNKKRDLSSITLKPSVRDKGKVRTTGTRTKKARNVMQSANFDDPFTSDPFNINSFGCSDESIDDTMSRQTTSSKQTSSTRHTTAFNTVHSDPSEFFSNQHMQLTSNNLELMAAMSPEFAQTTRKDDGIENINPRSKFHQFTIDEDKESTVILPVTYPDEDPADESEDEELDEDSQNSFGFTSKGTMIQNCPPRTDKTKTAKRADGFDNPFFNASSKEMRNGAVFPVVEDKHNGFSDPFFPNTTGETSFFPVKSSHNKTQKFQKNAKYTDKIRRDPSPSLPSSHSLVYSESSNEEAGGTDKGRREAEGTVSTIGDAVRSTKIRRRTRVPLSPLNGRHGIFNKTQQAESQISIAQGVRNKPDPDATWSTFQEKVARKPDPNGSDAKDLSTNENFVPDFGDTPFAMPSNSIREITDSGKKNSGNEKVNSRRPRRVKLSRETPTASDPFNLNMDSIDKGVNQLGRRDGVSGLASFAPSSVPQKAEKAKPDFNHVYPKSSREIWGGRSIPEDNELMEDEDDDILDFKDEISSPYRTRAIAPDKAMGIQSFPNAIAGSFSSSASQSSSQGHPKSLHRLSYHSQSHQSRSHSSSRSHYDNHSSLCSHGLPRSRCCHVEDNPLTDDNSVGIQSTSSASFTKPMGLPNNAIMASMLFRRHHNVDSHAVEAKIKAKEQEYKPDRKRGDIPQSIQASEDAYSSVSSFSEDTAAQIDAWRKPTKDLLEHFSRSRKTEFDFKKHLQEQRVQATALFEA